MGIIEKASQDLDDFTIGEKWNEYPDDEINQENRDIPHPDGEDVEVATFKFSTNTSGHHEPYVYQDIPINPGIVNTISFQVYPENFHNPHLTITVVDLSNSDWENQRHFHCNLRERMWKKIEFQMPKEWLDGLGKYEPDDEYPTLRIKLVCHNLGRLVKLDEENADKEVQDSRKSIYSIYNFRLRHRQPIHKGWQVEKGKIVTSQHEFPVNSEIIALVNPDSIVDSYPKEFIVLKDDMLVESIKLKKGDILKLPDGKSIISLKYPASEEGTYCFQYGNLKSRSFSVNGNIYRQLFETERQAVSNVRCGAETDWHGICHLDDVWVENSDGDYEKSDFVGGFLDAGDHWKNLATAVHVLKAVVQSAEENLDPESISRLLDLGRWAYAFIAKMEVPDKPGHYFVKTFPKTPSVDINEDCWTDNQFVQDKDKIMKGTNTGDDRIIKYSVQFKEDAKAYDYARLVYAQIGFANLVQKHHTIYSGLDWKTDFWKKTFENVSSMVNRITEKGIADEAVKNWNYYKFNNNADKNHPQMPYIAALACLEFYRWYKNSNDEEAVALEWLKRAKEDYLDFIEDKYIHKEKIGHFHDFFLGSSCAFSYDPSVEGFEEGPIAAFAKAILVVDKDDLEQSFPGSANEIRQRWAEVIRNYTDGWVKPCMGETEPFGIVVHGIGKFGPRLKPPLLGYIENDTPIKLGDRVLYSWNEREQKFCTRYRRKNIMHRRIKYVLLKEPDQHLNFIGAAIGAGLAATALESIPLDLRDDDDNDRIKRLYRFANNNLQFLLGLNPLDECAVWGLGDTNTNPPYASWVLGGGRGNPEGMGKDWDDGTGLKGAMGWILWVSKEGGFLGFGAELYTKVYAHMMTACSYLVDISKKGLLKNPE